MLQLSLAVLNQKVNDILGPRRITARVDLETIADSNALMLDLLKWLWHDAVQPVFTWLGWMSNKSPQHIYWVTSGLLGLMPLHAAGDHLSANAVTAMSCSVSSYIGSISMLRDTTSRMLDKQHKSAHSGMPPSYALSMA